MEPDPTPPSAASAATPRSPLWALLGRLGNVVFWLSSLLALLMGAGALSILATSESPDGTGRMVAWFLLAGALLLFGLGRAARYVLAGR